MFSHFHHIILRFALLMALLPLGLTIFSCTTRDNTISGFVQSGDQPIDLSTITLYSTGTGRGSRILGQSQSDASGFFRISYTRPSDPNAVLYLTADSDLLNTTKSNQLSNLNTIRLATMLGKLLVPTGIVINERTTIATAYAMAQFFTPAGIDGTVPGLQNAAATLRNLVNIETGQVGSVLGNPPNGNITSTLATFNSLANLLAACVRTESECSPLFSLATPPQGDAPTNTLEAAVNIAHFPWQNVQDILTQSQQQSLYSPALAPDAEIDAWTLAISHEGNGHELDGPGVIVFDKDGNAWVNNNYVFGSEPTDPEGNICGDDHLLKFTPTGEDFLGAPYKGGGLYGAGFGLTLDPTGDVWIGNFGFQGSNCPNDLTILSQSVSQFASDGTPISPNSQGSAMGEDHGGWPGAGNTIRRPQGTVSDKAGSIWIANCAGDSITKFPNGNPDAAFAIAPVDEGSIDPLLSGPFGLTIDASGNAWVASQGNDSVFAFDTDGNLIHSVTGMMANEAGIRFPMGIASDALGNIWVANSGIMRSFCAGLNPDSQFEDVETANDPEFMGEDASVTMILPDGTPSSDSPFKGGGLILPWGIAVDGNGNIWVTNFHGQRVSQLCGDTPENCPPGFQTGQPISPDGGYSSDALVRNTGVSIDPSGNVWLTNNWQLLPNPQNPGGHQVVVFIGLAKPVQAPLIGPPNL